ncbi:MAG: hypothetical protein COT74_09805 [Bdellovibrionales bacterium CG10_big_fil_rev_8_21_14_0_10_45_34]|nr:MAG: hypothetical protein COT74_09805 [Bdellovibrionales bacterium CG10_big_fil_rev_8_21_14_0_10_45_34]
MYLKNIFIKNILSALIALLLIIVGDPAEALAQAASEKPTEPKDALLYPELNVNPSASDRLLRAAKDEQSNRWITHWPIQVSALATLYSGLTIGQHPKKATETDRETSEWAKNVAYGVGGGWILATIVLSAAHQPYLEGYNEVKRLSEKTMSEKLTKERIAEEHLRKPAELGHKIMYISIATNLGASLFAASAGERPAEIMGIVSAVLSLTPLIFRSNWIEEYDTHLDYKKKIYGPVAYFGFIPSFDSQGVDLAPSTNLSWRF